MSHALPYGSWPSPIAPSDLTRAALGLSPGHVVDGVRYWAEGHPEQSGRIGLWRQAPEEEPTELTPDAYVRTGVNEYGGGAWAVEGDLLAYSSWPDGAVHLLESGAVRGIAAGAPCRYAALSLDPARRLLLAVREDHSSPGAEPVTTIVALDLDSDNPDGGRVLVSGADFYAHPRLGQDGRLAWCEWDHPNMPWDSTRIVVAPLADPTDRSVVAGGAGVSALYPSWAPDGGLLLLSDASGHWNFQRWEPEQGIRDLYPAPHDFCGPLWVLTPMPYTVIDAGRIGCSWLADGVSHLGLLAFDPAGSGPGRLLEIPNDAVTAEVGGVGSNTLALFGYADRPAELVDLHWTDGTVHTVRRASGVDLPRELVSRARPFTWVGPQGPVHAWFYPPANGDLTGLPGELPPVQVWSHGGPTAFSGPDFAVSVQFWTTRGIGILDVNYGGSTGYGRAYRDRLKGNWGVVDVRDCVDGVRALAAAGLADPARLSIRGGSAGGYTTLAALTSSDVFAAGISLYGIGDLEMLATDTHKFESRYLDRMVAPYPEGREIYLERSPIHHLDRLGCPMLILQGADDKVVPPNQAVAMADAVRAKGLPVELVIFEGEGHGFRRAENIIATAEHALAFLGRVHGFTPASVAGDLS